MLYLSVYIHIVALFIVYLFMYIVTIIIIDLFFYLHMYHCKETHLSRVFTCLWTVWRSSAHRATFRLAARPYILYL